MQANSDTPTPRDRDRRLCPPWFARVGVLAVLLLVGAAFATPPAVAAAPAAGDWPQFGEADETEAGPVVAGGSVYVTGFDGNLSVFDAAGCGASACKLRWQGHTGNDITSSVAVAGGVAYVGDRGGRLYAFTVGGCGAARCKPLWVGQAGAGQSLATPAVGGGRVFVGSFQATPEEFTGNLFAFPAAGCGKATCKPLRAYDVGDAGSTTTPALVGDTLLSSTQATPDPDTSGVVAAGKVVFVGKGPACGFPVDAGVYAFDVRGCGRPICQPRGFTQLGPDQSYQGSSIAVAGGKVMLNSTDNTGAPDVPAQTNLCVLALP